MAPPALLSLRDQLKRTVSREDLEVAIAVEDLRVPTNRNRGYQAIVRRPRRLASGSATAIQGSGRLDIGARLLFEVLAARE